MKIGALAASTTTTISLTYMPAVIHLVTTSAPTAVKVTVLGDGVIADLDAVGIAAASAMFTKGTITNGYYLPLANGIIKGKNVEITITNAQAAEVALYGYSTQVGSTYIRSLTQKVFALSGVQLSDFFQLCLPNMAAGGITDTLNVTYKGGFTQQMSPEDLRQDVGFDCIVQNGVNDIRVQNTDARVKMVSYVPAADENVYVFKYAPIGNL